jgi:stage II sporulation protein R
MKTRTRIFLIIGLILLYTLILSISYAKSVSSEIKDTVFRLHVLANSDENHDQELKLKVRDKIVEYLNENITPETSKDDVTNFVSKNIETIKEISKNVIEENGYSYDVNIYIGNFDFPTKEYGDVSLPAGNYDGMRVVIGNGDGQNWWCVLFPPLCFVSPTNGVVDEGSKETLEESLDDETYNIIANNDDAPKKIKFKILEIFGMF